MVVFPQRGYRIKPTASIKQRTTNNREKKIFFNKNPTQHHINSVRIPINDIYDII